MADAFDQFEILLKEFIEPAVVDLTLQDDDPMWNLIGLFKADSLAGKRRGTSTGSSATITYPAGFEASYRILVQRGGRVAGGRFLGNTTVMMGKDTHLAMGQAADAKYLDPRQTAARSHIEIGMILKRIRGSVTLQKQQILADLATQPIDEIVSGYVEDSIHRVRGYIVNQAYADGTASMAQVNDAAPSVVTETAGGTSITIDAGTWGRFEKGDLVVFGTAADPRLPITGAVHNPGRARVVAVDVDNRIIKVQSEPGEGDITLVDNAHIMLADTYDFTAASVALATTAGNGVESLLVNTGVFPGSIAPQWPSGLDVTHHTELKAFIEDDSSAQVDPTMDAITEMLDKILEQDPGRAPTAMIAERSLWTLFSQLERESQSLTTVPMATTFVGSGGVAGPTLSHYEHRFQRFSSKKIRPNSILGISPNTFKLFMPLGDRQIHWAYGTGHLSGFPSVFGPTYDGLQLTELADAPFDVFFELGCENPRVNMRKLGVKAQRDV